MRSAAPPGHCETRASGSRGCAQRAVRAAGLRRPRARASGEALVLAALRRASSRRRELEGGATRPGLTGSARAVAQAPREGREPNESRPGSMRAGRPAAPSNRADGHARSRNSAGAPGPPPPPRRRLRCCPSWTRHVWLGPGPRILRATRPGPECAAASPPSAWPRRPLARHPMARCGQGPAVRRIRASPARPLVTRHWRRFAGIRVAGGQSDGFGQSAPGRTQRASGR